VVRRWRGSRLASWSTYLSPHWVAILAILVLSLVFYMWTAASSVPFSFPTHSNDVYNLLTTAFLRGHLYLPIRTPAGFLHLHNPYDTAQNGPYQTAYNLHDLAFYKGRFYSTWGPTPAITLFLAFRITGHVMSESFAAAFFAFVGLACSVALLHLLVRRLVPRTPNWLLLVATVGLALTNVAPFILRRPAQYEVAISSGYCCAMAGILLVASAVLGSRVHRWRLALGSLCLGLAAGGRPDLIAGGVVAVAAAVYLVRRRGERFSVLIPALTPVIVCGLLLGAYNVVRFGSLGEFGTEYQLAGLDVQNWTSDQLSYVPPGLFSYLLIPPRFALTFPHVFLMTDTEYPFSLPRLYAGGAAGWPAEPAGGVLPTMPITLVLFALPLLWWRHRRGERAAVWTATGFALLALAIVVLLSYALWATTQRYEVDFATFFLIPAFLVWALLLARCRPRSIVRRGVAAGGIVLTLFGAAVGTAVSFTGYYNELALAHPGTFGTLEDITSPFATLVTMVAGHPVLVRVDGPSGVASPPQGYGNVGESGASTWLGAGRVTITVISPGSERLALRAAALRGPQVQGRGPVLVVVQSPGQQARLVPVSTGQVRVPIRLHWGLNRVELNTVVPNPAAPEQLYLGGISLSG
jgi:hypothetical protein